MARTTFGVGSLNAAAPGLSRLAGALIGGDTAYREGFDRAGMAQSKIAQTLAQIREANAAAGQHDATAAETAAKTATLQGRPGLFEEQAANASGVDIPTIQGYRKQLQTGQAPLVPMGPPTEAGQMGTGSMVLPDATRSKIAGAIQQFLPLLSNTGDLKPDDLAKASQLFRESGLSDAIINGTANRDTVAGAQAAAGGKDIYKTDATGAVLDQYRGGLATDNPLARSTIGMHDAQAAHSRASAAAATQGMKGVIQQTDDGMVLVDPRTGTARPILGPGGVQVAGKSPKLKDIPPTANAKIIEGQQGITNIDEAIASLEQNPNAGGWTNGIPGAQMVKQLWASPGDVATRGQVANIGSITLHDRSGAAVSASEFPRLAPFIPSPNDSNKVAATKLRNMKRIANEELGLYADTYSPDNGYRANPILQRHAQTAPAAPGPAAHGGGRTISVDY